MAAADGRRAVDAHAQDLNRGERRLSLTEGLVLCLVSEGPTFGLTLAGLLAPDGSLGLIRMTAEQRTGSGRARSFCEITPAGRAAAETWLRVPVDHVREVRSELMVKLALHNRAGSDSRPLVRAQLARLAPAAAALEDRLGAATGFERTIVLWRHEAMTPTMQFLTALAKSRRRAPARANWKGPSLRS